MSKNDNNTGSIKESLQSTGIFLERYVFDYLRTWDKVGAAFTASREYPYHYQSPYSNQDLGGEIDILASKGIETRMGFDNVVLVMPIECKKADPKYKDWVFECNRPRKNEERQYFPSSLDGKIEYTSEVLLNPLGYNDNQDYEDSINVFEYSAKGSLNKSTEKEKRAYYAIQHVSEATSGLLLQAQQFSPQPTYQHVFVPIVVTTANLHVIKPSMSLFDVESGLLPAENIGLEQKDWVLSAYRMSNKESLTGERRGHGPFRPISRPIFVVRAGALEEFISNLIESIKIGVRF